MTVTVVQLATRLHRKPARRCVAFPCVSKAILGLTVRTFCLSIREEFGVGYLAVSPVDNYVVAGPAEAWPRTVSSRRG